MLNKIDAKHLIKAQHFYNSMQEIADKAEIWKSTSYKKATDELYNLLSDCYSCTAQIRLQSTAVVRELNYILGIYNIPFNDGTKLETKVVRVVFGDIGKRAHIYARVLVNAREQHVEAKNFVDWLNEQGGVEAVRKQYKGLTPSQRKAQRIEKAEKALPRVKEKQLSNAPKVDGSNYVLALVQHTNGKQRIVGFCDSVTLIKEAMSKLADTAEKQASVEIRADLERENRKFRQQIKQAASLTAKAA